MIPSFTFTSTRSVSVFVIVSGSCAPAENVPMQINAIAPTTAPVIVHLLIGIDLVGFGHIF